MNRFAKSRRDANEPELIQYARNFGPWLYQLDTPFDWLILWRGRLDFLEIKNPNQEGHADEYTPKQRVLLVEIYAHGGRLLVWRTKDDVLRDLSARVAA